MKFLYTLLLSVVCFGASAQYSFYHTFESPFNAYRANFYIDTVNCSNNMWQIGKPQKTIFDSAYSFPNVIVTDTLNQYPANDTSIFYISTGGTYHALLTLSFFYQLDIDSLSTAKIEISGDRGVNWINPITEDTTYMFYWVNGKPRLDTSTIGWQKFELNMDVWSYSYPGSYNVFPHYRTSDTIIYRFTFISGDSTVHHDGWMMDNFQGENTGRVGIKNNNLISLNIFPNPSNGVVTMHPNFKWSATDKIVVYNIQGQQVYNTTATGAMSINLPLPDGVYTLKYYSSEGVATERVVIMH